MKMMHALLATQFPSEQTRFGEDGRSTKVADTSFRATYLYVFATREDRSANKAMSTDTRFSVFVADRIIDKQCSRSSGEQLMRG